MNVFLAFLRSTYFLNSGLGQIYCGIILVSGGRFLLPSSGIQMRGRDHDQKQKLELEPGEKDPSVRLSHVQSYGHREIRYTISPPPLSLPLSLYMYWSEPNGLTGT